jgi:hypothetical protein
LMNLSLRGVPTGKQELRRYPGKTLWLRRQAEPPESASRKHRI